MASTKRYRCIYCGKMYTREDLVRHLEDKHLDELPETFSPLRVAYHIANNKDFSYRRKCRICKADTSWDEKKGRYNQLCDKPECHRKQALQMNKDMGDRKGINAQTKTPEGLEKMLAGRRISGQYKWHDSTIFSYTGTYEKAALEFMDKVMEIKSEDLQVPGPVCTYMLDGKEHYYIPDMYYIPYDLIIEVKDGGDRGKNLNKNYAETRRKQIAKEEHIIKNTNHNYVRLTDKDMSQLLVIFSQLKMELVDGTNERVIRINESTLLEEISRVDIKSGYLEDGDSCYNLNKWGEPGNNILFITGLSGSGKTTLAVDLAKEFSCQRVELDNIAVYYMKKCKERNAYEKFYNKVKAECPKAVKFFDNNPVSKYGMRDTWANTSDILADFVKWFIKETTNDGNLYIVNGGYIIGIFDTKYFYNRPLIMKNINIAKSTFRRTWREFLDPNDDIKKKITSGYKAFKVVFKSGYRKANDEFKQYKKDLDKHAAIIESKLEDGTEDTNVCPKCGGEIRTFLYAEPIRKCKDCGYVLGVIPFKKETTIDNTKSDLVTEKGILKSDHQLLSEAMDIIDGVLEDTDYSILEQYIHEEVLLEAADDGLENQYKRILVHLIKYKYSTGYQSTGWLNTIYQANDAINSNKSYNKLFAKIDQDKLYKNAAKDAKKEMEKYDNHIDVPKKPDKDFEDIEKYKDKNNVDKFLIKYQKSEEVKDYIKKGIDSGAIKP